jgi:hypothetical protein
LDEREEFFKTLLRGFSTFENHCLEGKIDFWRPLPRLWRGKGAIGATGAIPLGRLRGTKPPDILEGWKVIVRRKNAKSQHFRV